jgi:alpha-1,6-mannosyltransferase
MAVIAHLANFYTPTSGGLRTAMDALTLEYIRGGHEVHTIVPGTVSDARTTGSVTIHHVPSIQLPGFGGYRVIASAGRVQALLRDIGPDSVELSDRLTLLSAADWARDAGVPSSLIAHERIDGVLRAFLPFIPRRAVADRMNASAARRVDTIVCTTRFAAEEFDRIGVPTALVPLGVDLRMFNPSQRSARLRRQFPEQVLLVLASRLSREKRPDFAVDVLDSCLRRGMDCRLVVLGQGPLTERMVRRSVGRPMTVLGHVSSRAEMAQVLASADVVLAPGPIETFGLAALEALACGTPVICNEESAIPEVLGPDAGFARALDSGLWADCVEAVIGDSGPVRARARRRAEEFPWSRTAHGLLHASGITGARVPASTAASTLREGT